MKDISDTKIKFSLNYQSKIGYGTLIQNVILKEIGTLMSVISLEIDTGLKMKISRKK